MEIILYLLFSLLYTYYNIIVVKCQELFISHYRIVFVGRMVKCMERRKKYIRKLNKLGKMEYDFDLQLELVIYKYVCYMHLTRKEKKKLDKKNQFNFYREWKKYIIDKYKDYKQESLTEFSRYLNQRKRNNQPIREYWYLVIPVVLTLALSAIFDLITQNGHILYNLSIGQIITLCSLIILLMFFLIVFVIRDTMMPMLDANIENNMLTDYIEIIEGIIIDKEHTH